MTSAVAYKTILGRHAYAEEWLQILGNLGRAAATVDAYGHAIAHYLRFCEEQRWNAEEATFEQITLYIRGLLPGHPNAVANATLQQRLTAIRLWYDHLMFQGLRENNPVPRGQHSRVSPLAIHSGFVRGLVPRLATLPTIPTDEEWGRLLLVASQSPVRDRLMLSLAYCGALRRAELVALRVEDLDVAHRLISVRAETTKSRRTRVVCYSPVITPLLISHLRSLSALGLRAGPLFRSFSDRNRGAPLSRWTWTKTVETWTAEADLPRISTHTFRHLRLTHLARAGWKLHELSTYAGHCDPKTTLVYLHLSGTELTAKMAMTITKLDAVMFSQIAGDGRSI